MSEVKRYQLDFNDCGMENNAEFVLATDYDATKLTRVKAEAECERQNWLRVELHARCAFYRGKLRKLRAELAALKAQQADQKPAPVVPGVPALWKKIARKLLAI